MAFITVISAKSNPLFSERYKEAYFHMAKDMLCETEAVSGFWKKKFSCFYIYRLSMLLTKVVAPPGFDLTMEFFILILSLESNQVSLNHSFVTARMCALKEIPNPLDTTISFPLIKEIIQLI